jgi:hypothetical protein
MTKEQFLALLAQVYAVGNRSDSDSEVRETWTHPDMAGPACCALLDKMLTRMCDLGVLTADEHQRFIDDLV